MEVHSGEEQISGDPKNFDGPVQYVGYNNDKKKRNYQVSFVKKEGPSLYVFGPEM